MKDFPVFTTEAGVASLTLRQIPYRKEAYIRPRDWEKDHKEELVQECARFCRLAGAELVYVWDEEQPDVQILEMRGVPGLDPDQVENIFPVTDTTVTVWRRIANQKLRDVDLAGMLPEKEEAEILSSGGAYFIHRQGTLLGIGWLQKDTLKLLASVVPGEGFHVAQTLLSVQPGESIRLEVASTNQKAIRLYERLGFAAVRALESWKKLP